MIICKRRNIRCAALIMIAASMVVFGGSIRLALGDKKPSKLVPSSANKDVAQQTTLKQTFYPVLNDREKRIDEELDNESVAPFPKIALHEVITYLSELHNISIQIEKQGLEQAGVSPDEPIDVDLKDLPLKDELDFILEPLNLTYVIDHNMLLITSRQKADRTFKTRVYPVGDLCQTDDDYQALIAAIQNANLGSWERTGKSARTINSAQNKKRTANSDKESGFFNIQGSVIVEVGSPLPGGISGGSHDSRDAHPNYTGTISAVPHSQSLVISQTFHAHKAIAELLTQLRKSQADQRGN